MWVNLIKIRSCVLLGGLTVLTCFLVTLRSIWMSCECWLLTRFIFINLYTKKFFLRGLYNKLLKDWSRGKRLMLFPLNLNVSLGRFSGKKINCFSWDQLLSVYYITYLLNHFLVLALNNWRLLLPWSENLPCETITLVRIGLRLNKAYKG